MSLAALGRRLLERMGTGPTELDEFELERVLAYVSTLEQYIQECDWLARRYAEGRRTYATGQYNDAKRAVLATGLELELDPLTSTPWARDGSGARFCGLSAEEYAQGKPLERIDIQPELEPDRVKERERLVALEERVKLLEQVYCAADIVWDNTKNINEGYWGVDGFAMDGLVDALEAVQQAARVGGKS